MSSENKDGMHLSDYNYDLPQELIAQDPLEDRAASRLLMVNKNTGEIKHEVFRNIIDYLNHHNNHLISYHLILILKLYDKHILF